MFSPSKPTFIRVSFILTFQDGRIRAIQEPRKYEDSGDSDQGIYVGEWMLPRCYGIDYSERGLLITNKNLVVVERILGF